MVDFFNGIGYLFLVEFQEFIIVINKTSNNKGLIPANSVMVGLLPKYPFRLPESVLNKSSACER